MQCLDVKRVCHFEWLAQLGEHGQQGSGTIDREGVTYIKLAPGYSRTFLFWVHTQPQSRLFCGAFSNVFGHNTRGTLSPAPSVEYDVIRPLPDLGLNLGYSDVDVRGSVKCIEALNIILLSPKTTPNNDVTIPTNLTPKHNLGVGFIDC